jgi:hypothetical protein
MKGHSVSATAITLLIAAQACWSQEFRGNVVGHVLDTSGAVVPGAVVTATKLCYSTNFKGVSYCRFFKGVVPPCQNAAFA